MDLEKLKQTKEILLQQVEECEFDFAKKHLLEVVKEIERLISFVEYENKYKNR